MANQSQKFEDVALDALEMLKAFEGLTASVRDRGAVPRDVARSFLEDSRRIRRNLNYLAYVLRKSYGR